MSGRPTLPAWWNEYRVELRRLGRWSWSLYITQGPTIIGDPMWGSPRCFGSRERAERKARRIVAGLMAADKQLEREREQAFIVNLHYFEGEVQEGAT